jgi:hypothetical protein
MAMYQQAEGKRFMLLYAWRMLKNEPKWSNPNEPNKRTKISTSKGYSSSSKPNTPTSGDHIASNSMESNVVRPIGTKAAKRNGKSKANEKVVHIDLTRMEDAQQSYTMEDWYVWHHTHPRERKNYVNFFVKLEAFPNIVFFSLYNLKKVQLYFLIFEIN